jgi:predicted SAM-dependent methyltransferase
MKEKPVTARETLSAYFALVDQEQEQLAATNPTDSRMRKLTKHAVPVRYRGTARMVATDAVRFREKRKAQAVEAVAQELRLHLGSGAVPKDGWVNIDLLGDPVDIAWNLAHGIPFSDGSADAVFHEHLFEHIPLRAGLGLMEEIFRVLKPGGVVRVGVPDAGELLRSYAGDGTYLEQIHPGRPTRLLGVQELFYWHRHMTMYDEETLALVFEAAGFRDPERREFGESKFLDDAPDTEHRRAETLYMEAVKP